LDEEGWMTERAYWVWILRFRHGWESWDQNPKVFIDKGRLEANGIPPP